MASSISLKEENDSFIHLIIDQVVNIFQTLQC